MRPKRAAQMTPEEERAARIRNERLKSLWLIVIIVSTVAGMFAGGVIWIADVNNHFDRVEQHMDYQDRQVWLIHRETEWLIRQNPDSKDAPDGFTQPDNQP